MSEGENDYPRGPHPCSSHRFDGVSSKLLFFQSQFAVPSESAGAKLAELNDASVALFETPGNGCGYNGPYFPLLSLVYGEVKQSRKDALESSLVLSTRGSYRCPRLELWFTIGQHEQWHVVHAIELE